MREIDSMLKHAILVAWFLESVEAESELRKRFGGDHALFFGPGIARTRDQAGMTGQCELRRDI